MIAAVVLAASQHISMIVIGRIFQGIAVSFCTHPHRISVCDLHVSGKSGLSVVVGACYM